MYLDLKYIPASFPAGSCPALPTTPGQEGQKRMSLILNDIPALLVHFCFPLPHEIQCQGISLHL
jgi:hypothetical protein